MRFGCCLNMVSSKEDKGTGISLVGKLARMGYDYVELPLAEMTALSEEEFQRLEEQVRDSGIRCEVCNNFFPKTLRLTGDEADMDEIMAYVRKALGRAKRLGVEYVVFGSGPAKSVPEGYPLEKGYEQVAALLREMDGIAGEHGVTIVIEPLRKQECNLINTFEEGCRLAEYAGGKNIKALVDYYHMRVEKEPDEHVETYGKEYLRHVHFANPCGRVYPKDKAESDYESFFKALKKAGYNARISCEAYTDDFDADAPKSLKVMKELAGLS